MAAAPAKTCSKCGRPLPKEKETTDGPTRGKRWTRLTIVMPTQEDKDALEDKLEILAQRWEEKSGNKVARFILLDWALSELIDRNIAPEEEGG